MSIELGPDPVKKVVKDCLSCKPFYDFKTWRVNSPIIYPYEDSFYDFLEEKTFGGLVEDIRTKKGRALVLDFMGYGHVLEHLDLTGGLAVALCDPRSLSSKSMNEQRNIELIEGNVLKRATWHDIKSWLDRQRVDEKKFDLILSRPVGGLDDLTFNRDIHISLLQRAWTVLSQNEGMLFTQMQELMFSRREVENWVGFLKDNGVSAVYSSRKNRLDEISIRPSLVLTRTSESPEKLPILPYS